MDTSKKTLDNIYFVRELMNSIINKTNWNKNIFGVWNSGMRDFSSCIFRKNIKYLYLILGYIYISIGILAVIKLKILLFVMKL